MPIVHLHSIVIRMTERNPVNKYSKTSYQKGLDQLSEAERKINAHPLREELAVHQELREGSVAPYPFAEEEGQVQAALERETEDFQKEVTKIRQELRRQLSIAQTEAIATNDEMKNKRLAQIALPQINQMESEIEQRIQKKPTNLNDDARKYGYAVLGIAEDTKLMITSQKPSSKDLESSFGAITEMYNEFIKRAGNVLRQDRYGHAT